MNYRKFPRNPQPIGEVYRKQVFNEDGSSTVLESEKSFDSPFIGLDARSFSASSQLRAGVSLTPAPSLSPIGSTIGSVDRVSAEFESNMLSNPK